MIKIALAEDNGFLAQSLINKLGLFDEFKVKFQAINGQELLHALDGDANLDVILMDIQMPVMDGIVATEEVTRKYPHIKIIMLTVLDSEQKIYEAIQAGAMGYLLKESTPNELQQSIHEILDGGAPMSPEVSRKAMKIIRNPDRVHVEEKNFDLSAREREVLQHLSQGLDTNQISANLFISPNTVKRHMEKIYRKLEVHNKAEALQRAYQYKLV